MMIEIDECKAVIADGYTISQKGESLTATLSGSFKQSQPQLEIKGMDWKGGDAVREVYAENVKIFGEMYDVVVIARRHEA